MFTTPQLALRFILTETNTAKRRLVNQAAQQILEALEASGQNDQGIIEALQADKTRLEERVLSLESELAALKAPPMPQADTSTTKKRRTTRSKEDNVEEDSA